MNGYEKMRYKAFQKVKGIKLGTKFSGVPPAKKIEEQNDIYMKKSFIWGDIGDIYFKLPQGQEALKETFI